MHRRMIGLCRLRGHAAMIVSLYRLCADGASLHACAVLASSCGVRQVIWPAPPTYGGLVFHHSAIHHGPRGPRALRIHGAAARLRRTSWSYKSSVSERRAARQCAGDCVAAHVALAQTAQEGLRLELRRALFRGARSLERFDITNDLDFVRFYVYSLCNPDILHPHPHVQAHAHSPNIQTHKHKLMHACTHVCTHTRTHSQSERLEKSKRERDKKGDA
ncbi:hypothetical protein EVAR_6735_1 [Eumeta japonica]|uniref:Uncharacterized protein n=1 Tax=Eumeta variegata TaxID=151549 RepID=A0A4C1V536_EUMVA|nr:hypothetical protein EVAR_6735_1 [Eumeta japonica]